MRNRSSQLRDSCTSLEGPPPAAASLSNARRASCNSSGSSTSAPSAARALATTSQPCQGSAVMQGPPSPAQPSDPQSCCCIALAPVNVTTISAAPASLWPLPQALVATETGDRSSPGSGESSRLRGACELLGLWAVKCDASSGGAATSAAMASLVISTCGSVTRCSTSRSREPAIARQMSGAVSSGSSPGGSSQIRRTSASGLPASNGRRRAANSKRHTPNAQTSAAGP
mmetsp:Transcript_57566/g.168606  ORF Transcript_57566/g.168606 Transcript_57566/m.168606 type:complete len:229 (-) Transcript_57566:600-1286(-)